MKLSDVFSIVKNENIEGHVILFDGDEDIGKSYLIKQIYQKMHLRIHHFIHSSNIIEDICLSELYSKQSIDFAHIDRESLSFSNNILNICITSLKGGYTLWFDDISSYDEVSYDFLIQLISIFNCSDCVGSIILECNLDKLEPINKQRYFFLISKLEDKFKFHLKPKQLFDVEMNTFIDNCIKNNDISLYDKKMICEACSFKFNLIIALIEYLKSIFVIYMDNGRWCCNSIDNIILNDFLNDFISTRFNKLNAYEKDIIQKATLSGIVIHTKLLEYAFHYVNLNQYLSKIENQTKLIVNLEDFIYKYENNTVYFYIDSLINIEDKILWNKQMSDFLILNIDKIKDLDKRVFAAKKIAGYLYNANQLSKSAIYLVKYACMAIDLNDYDGIIKAGKQVLNIVKVEPIPNDYKILMQTALGFAYQMKAEYIEAIKYYELISDTETSLEYIFNYATCLYNGGYYSKALILLESINVSTIDKTSIEIVFLKACIYNHMGEDKKFKYYYQVSLEYAIEIKDNDMYFKIKRNCDMFLDSELAIPIIRKSYEYFKHNKFEQAKIGYNLGINYIFMSQFDKAEQLFLKADSVFSNYNSKNQFFSNTGLGIVQAIKGSIESAISFFKKSLVFYTDFFAEINIYLNLVMCYCLEKDFNQAYSLLHECDKRIASIDENTLLLQRNLNLAWASYCELTQNYIKSYEYLQSAFNIEKYEMKYETYNVVIAKRMLSISKIINRKNKDEIQFYENSKLSSYKKYLVEKKAIWFYLLFWGL